MNPSPSRTGPLTNRGTSANVSVTAPPGIKETARRGTDLADRRAVVLLVLLAMFDADAEHLVEVDAGYDEAVIDLLETRPRVRRTVVVFEARAAWRRPGREAARRAAPAAAAAPRI